MDDVQYHEGEAHHALSSSNCYIDLPLLMKMLNQLTPSLTQKPLKHTAIFYVHHPLQTSLNIIEAIIHLGAKPKNIFIIGKRYSECSDVVNA